MEIKKGSTNVQPNQTNNAEVVSSKKATTQDKTTASNVNPKDKFETAVKGAAQTQGITPTQVSPKEEKTVRNFYEEGWNKRDVSVLQAHPQIAQECHRELIKHTEKFPDLQINVNSLQKRNEEVWVNWTAQGSRISEDSGKKIQQTVDGLTRMKINDGEITSAKATWNDRRLQQNLNKISG